MSVLRCTQIHHTQLELGVTRLPLELRTSFLRYNVKELLKLIAPSFDKSGIRIYSKNIFPVFCSWEQNSGMESKYSGMKIAPKPTLYTEL